MNSYPLFLDRASRDEYLDKLIANGHRVKARVTMVHEITYYTVEEIDFRKGK
jgi:hypothetical protein